MILFNRLVLSTCDQAGGAPLIDEARTIIHVQRGGDEGFDSPMVVEEHPGYAVVWPWNLGWHGRTRKPCKAFVVGVIFSAKQRERRARKRINSVTKERCKGLVPADGP